MSVVIIAGGSGRAVLRRFEAKQNDPNTQFPGLTAAQATAVNDRIADLEKLADEFGCPEDPCPE